MATPNLGLRADGATSHSHATVNGRVFDIHVPTQAAALGLLAEPRCRHYQDEDAIKFAEVNLPA
jgi:hypothetical protein